MPTDTPESGGESDAQAMVDFLKRHVRVLMSERPEPVPACPRCGSVQEVRWISTKQRRAGRLPGFLCQSCGRPFNRVTGTPLARSLLRHQLEPFIGLLAEPLSLDEAARYLLTFGPAAVARYVRTFRRWLLVLEPSGRFERAVQLGSGVTAVRDSPRSFPDHGAHEDVYLTAMITADFDEIHSRSTVPSQCQYARQKDTDKRRELIRYLGLPLSVTQMAEILETDPRSIECWIVKFMQRCAQVDELAPLLSRFRLGACLDRKTTGVACWRQGRRLNEVGCAVCAGCGQIIPMYAEVSERAGVLEIGPRHWAPHAGQEAGAPLGST